MDQQLHSPTSVENVAGRAVPAARPLSDFSVEQIDEDLIILDGETLQYHTLNGAASQIWRLCDGKTASVEIADRLGMTIELVEITVADLGVAGLLQSPADSFTWTSTMNRRRAMKLVAAGAAGAVGLPVVLSLTAPTHQAAATIGAICASDAQCDAPQEACCGSVCRQAGTGSNYPCTSDEDCCSGNCNTSGGHCQGGGPGGAAVFGTDFASDEAVYSAAIDEEDPYLEDPYETYLEEQAAEDQQGTESGEAVEEIPAEAPVEEVPADIQPTAVIETQMEVPVAPAVEEEVSDEEQS